MLGQYLWSENGDAARPECQRSLWKSPGDTAEHRSSAVWPQGITETLESLDHLLLWFAALSNSERTGRTTSGKDCSECVVVALAAARTQRA
jgi:hypothetical protein